MSGVVVVGSFNVDHVWSGAQLPQPGETRSGGYQSGAGGKGFNQAVAAARAGAETTFICALGDDSGGQLARELAAAEGIDMRAQACDLPTGAAGIFVDAAGRNCIVVAAGANAQLSAGFIEAQRAAIAGATVVLVQLEIPVAAAQAALAAGRAGGAISLLNPAPADVDVPASLLSLLDVLTPNETEFCALLARHAGVQVDPDALAGLDDAALHALCRRMLRAGSLVLTLGAQGCFVSHPDHAVRGDADVFYRLRAEAVEAVDTTGAGDAFSGALAARLARAPGAPFEAHVRFANRYAALSTQRSGAAMAMPSANEVGARWPGGA